MNKNYLFMIIACALTCTPFVANAAGTMSKSDYSKAKSQIVADYKSARIGCNSLAGNAKDICVEEVKGKENVAKAELEAQYTGKESDQFKLRMAHADANYAVAKEKCDDKGGNEKDICVTQAKAEFTKAKSDANLRKTVAKATTESIEDRLTADYKVATEKCDALAGEFKASCITAAKAKYGKA